MQEHDYLKRLSIQLFPLGEQVEEIWSELRQAGLGVSSSEVRQLQLEFADMKGVRGELLKYWREYAKERIACLSGPCSIETGHLTEHSGYRSEFLDKLRALKVEQSLLLLEPTLERFWNLCMQPQSAIDAKIREKTLRAVEVAALNLNITEPPLFKCATREQKTEMLFERYAHKIERKGFKRRSNKSSLALERQFTNAPLLFMLLDDCDEDIADPKNGRMSCMFAVCTPNKPVRARGPSPGVLAKFHPKDIVPEYQFDQAFKGNSYAKFCLAADSNSFLAETLFRRIDALIKA